jgi:hypothetical protein
MDGAVNGKIYLDLDKETDHIEAAGAPVDILWGTVTMADVETHGKPVELKRKGEVVHGRRLQPEDAIFETVSCNPSALARNDPPVLSKSYPLNF